MPILQHNLVMKSIEALHDEALSLATDTASNHGTTATPIISHAATPLQESRTDASSDTSAKAPPETAGDHDIMARIDHLLKKLDDDDADAVTPIADEGPPNIVDMTRNAIDTATTSNIAVDNQAIPESLVLSNTAIHANEGAIPDAAEDGLPENTARKPSGKSGDDANKDMFVDDQSAKTVRSDQTQALADIAAAIYHAGQQKVDTVVADATQNNTVPFDMNVLSATVADEVRRTVSAVMIAELPQMVREAVIEAIHSLPADALGQSTPTAVNPSTPKSMTTRKTAATKKAIPKKVRTKKAGSKKRPEKKATGKAGPLT